MRCPPISQHHRRGRRVGAEVSRLINEAGHAPRIGAGNGALGQTTARGSGARPAHWSRQRCIGADNGPGIRGTPRVLGQATAHWGRQRPGDPGHAPRIGAGNGALGQTNCLLQCLFSCPNAAHRTRGRTAAVVSSHGVRPKRRRRRPDQANGGSSAVPTDCVQHTRRWRSVFTAIPRSAWADPQGCPAQRLCFHSNTTLSQRYHTLQAL